MSLTDIEISKNKFLTLGLCKSAHKSGKPLEIRSAKEAAELKADTELLVQRRRLQMQDYAEMSHKSERRWTNIDTLASEMRSSHCCIVGFFVGYGCAMGRQESAITDSELYTETDL
jgi:hypothetical protein